MGKYNPYYDARIVYDQKTQWHWSTTDFRRKLHSDAAEQARQRLRANGYKDIADQIGPDADLVTTRDVAEKLRVDSGLIYDKVPEVPEKLLKPTTTAKPTTTPTTTAPSTTTSTSTATPTTTTTPTASTSTPTSTTTVTKPTTTTSASSSTGAYIDNPYNALKSVYNAKVAWGNATTDEERQRQSQIANNARQQLIDNGYDYLATQVSADGATADTVKTLLDAWAKQVDTTTGNYKTGVDNPAYNAEISSASKKNDTRDALILSDHANVNGMYKDLYGYANQDITQTDEYKSAFANIMPSYNYAAMQGHANEVATGGANNGGNIDSFSAANASRQQAALTAKGQVLAHQMGIDAYNSRVGNVQNVVSNLGAYNSSVYSALNDGVNNSHNIANSIFNNSETAKNNQVYRDVAVSEAAGELTSGLLYQLPEYSQFFNPDGSLKNENIDYTTEIKKAEEAGNTRLAEVLKVARGTKIWNDYAQWGQYDDGNYTLPGRRQTESGRVTDEQIKSANYAIDASTKQTELKLESDKDLLQTQMEFEKQNPKPAEADKEQIKLSTDSTISQWLYTPYADLSKTSVYKNQDPKVHSVYYAAQKINDPEILPWIKESLANAGYDAGEITKKIAEYRDNIAKQILRAEGVLTTDPAYEDKLKAAKDKHNLN